MKIALDIGHRGKPSSPNDRGAPGEMTLAFRYWVALDEALRDRGREVLGPFSGEYQERIRVAAAWGADLFLQIHADAGGGRRATWWHDARSKGGTRLGALVRDYRAFPDSAYWDLESLAARPDTDGLAGNEGERVYSVLAPVFPFPRLVGALWEVGFTDGGSEHIRVVREHADEICRGVARAVTEWGASR